MKRRTKIELQEHLKMALCMIAGAVLLLCFQIQWLIDRGCFVRKPTPQQMAEQAAHDLLYDFIAANPTETD